MAVEQSAHLTRNVMVCTLHRIILCNRVMEYRRIRFGGGGACKIYREKDRCIQSYGWET